MIEVTRIDAMAALLALAVLMMTPAAGAQTVPAPADPFPDTPANRQVFQESLRTYEDIDHAHGHFADVNGIRMHYLEWGNVRGIPLVWSHGYGSTDFELIQVGQGLADLGYHVFAIAYRGHGQTQVTNFNFSLSNIADDIAALLDQKGYRCAVIGGLSLGGGVATTFYEIYPQRAIALVLEDGGADAIQARMEMSFATVKPLFAAAPAASQDWAFSDQFAAYRMAMLPYLPLVQLRPETAPIFHSFIRRDDSGAWRFHADMTRLLGEGEVSQDPARGYELPLLAQSWRRVNPTISYRNLSVPILIIDPTGDDAGPYGSFSPEFQRLQALHPDLIRHVEYPETFHAAHPQRPDWFLRDMKDLLARVRAVGSDACLGRK